MGKKRVTQLLERLKKNQQAEVQNAAAIFTVAQVAVNQLQEKVSDSVEPTVAALPPAPRLFDKAELLRRYGSYQGCRKAAKELGIKFSRTPSWQQLIMAFSYIETFQQMIESYLKIYPTSELHGITFKLEIE